MSYIQILKLFFVAAFSDKTPFCLREKDGMLVNDECSSCYNRGGEFLVEWNSRKQLLYVNGAACMAQLNNTTPECVVNGTECYDG